MQKKKLRSEMKWFEELQKRSDIKQIETGRVESDYSDGFKIRERDNYRNLTIN